MGNLNDQVISEARALLAASEHTVVDVLSSVVATPDRTLIYLDQKLAEMEIYQARILGQAQALTATQEGVLEYIKSLRRDVALKIQDAQREGSDLKDGT